MESFVICQRKVNFKVNNKHKNNMSNLSITGEIVQILEAENGTSKAGKEWQKQSFVINTGSEFNPEVCFSLFGAEKMAMLNNLKGGQSVEVLFNVSSREFNGRYYHNLDAWKISVDALENEPAAADIPAATEEDDLPF
jgi:hypothetical protein